MYLSSKHHCLYLFFKHGELCGQISNSWRYIVTIVVYFITFFQFMHHIGLFLVKFILIYASLNARQGDVSR